MKGIEEIKSRLTIWKDTEKDGYGKGTKWYKEECTFGINDRNIRMMGF